MLVRNCCLIIKEKIKNAKRVYKITFLLVLLFSLLGIVLVMFSEQKDEYVQKSALEVVELSNLIRKGYQNRSDYWGLSTESLIKNGIVPASMIKNNELINLYNKEIEVGNISGGMLMPGSRSFNIIYLNLDRRECVDLASYKFDEKFWLGVMSVTISHNDTMTTLNWSSEPLLPINKKQARIICRNSNKIIWRFE